MKTKRHRLLLLIFTLLNVTIKSETDSERAQRENQINADSLLAQQLQNEEYANPINSFKQKNTNKTENDNFFNSTGSNIFTSIAKLKAIKDKEETINYFLKNIFSEHGLFTRDSPATNLKKIYAIITSLENILDMKNNKTINNEDLMFNLCQKRIPIRDVNSLIKDVSREATVQRHILKNILEKFLAVEKERNMLCNKQNLY